MVAWQDILNYSLTTLVVLGSFPLWVSLGQLITDCPELAFRSGPARRKNRKSVLLQNGLNGQNPYTGCKFKRLKTGVFEEGFRDPGKPGA